MWRIFQKGKAEGQALNEQQRRLLCDMMHLAFVEIRMVGYHGEAEQAARLASAFHNLPLLMYSPEFNWFDLREVLRRYQRDYPREKWGLYDYVTALGKAREAV